MLLAFAFFVPAILAYPAACIGHIALCTVVLNVLYGRPWPRSLLHGVRLMLAVTAVAGPVVFLWVFGWDLTRGWHADEGGWQTLLLLYALVCWIVGLFVFPLVTCYRIFRKQPAAVLDNHAHTFDVAQRLGYKPAGYGKYRPLCHFPGNEVFKVDITEQTFCLPRLPEAWDGLTILHVTDLHLCGSPDKVYYEQVMDLCREPVPDILAITGDIVDSDKHHRWVVPVLGRLRWKAAAFAILGNHDYLHEPNLVRRRLRKLGIRVLGNIWEELEVRGQALLAIGNETPWFMPGPDLANCPRAAFRLCLSHTPDTMAWAKANGIDLMLAGHNHGGQIRVPVIGSIFVPSRYSRKYDCGVFHEPPTLLHVSRGLGGQQPLRYLCRPEVTRIVLRSPVAVAASAAQTIQQAATA
jgi:predicted MPP superfamily phosphohydrolase